MTPLALECHFWVIGTFGLSSEVSELILGAWLVFWFNLKKC